MIYNNEQCKNIKNTLKRIKVEKFKNTTIIFTAFESLLPHSIRYSKVSTTIEKS